MEKAIRIISVQTVVRTKKTLTREALEKTDIQVLTNVIGTPLFGHMVKPNGDPNEVTVIRAGIFDDLQIMEERKPELEIYTDRRPQWLNAIEGAGQVNGMLPT